MTEKIESNAIEDAVYLLGDLRQLIHRESNSDETFRRFCLAYLPIICEVALNLDEYIDARCSELLEEMEFEVAEKYGVDTTGL